MGVFSPHDDKFFGLSMAIMGAGNAIGAVVVASDYVSAGISVGVGMFWIMHLEMIERKRG